jgi:hypothetical protein
MICNYVKGVVPVSTSSKYAWVESLEKFFQPLTFNHLRNVSLCEGEKKATSHFSKCFFFHLWIKFNLLVLISSWGNVSSNILNILFTHWLVESCKNTIEPRNNNNREKSLMKKNVWSGVVISTFRWMKEPISFYCYCQLQATKCKFNQV